MTAVIDIPSHMRPAPGSVNIALASFPPVRKNNKALPLSAIAEDFVNTFNKALEKKDLGDLSQSFLRDGFWRDHLALTWEFRTVQGPVDILQFLKSSAKSRDGLRIQSISVDASNTFRAPKLAPVDADGEVVGIQFFLTIETAVGTGQGLVRLIEENDQWKTFTLYTRLEELKGHEQAIFDRRPTGVDHGGQPGRTNWADKRAAAANYTDGSEPAVLVLGTSDPSRTDEIVTDNDNRWWPSRPYSRRAPQDHGREYAHCRSERSCRRQLAEALPSARSSRPGMV